MDPSQQMVDYFENYLKEDLKKQKQKIKEIERNLEILKSFKPRKSKSSDRSQAESDLKESFLGESSNSPFPAVPPVPPFPPAIQDEQLYLNDAKQLFMMTDEEDNKLDLIIQLFRCHRIENSIIYCNSIENVENLTTFLSAEGFNVQNMVGKNAKQRKQIIEDLNSDVLEIEALITVRRIDTSSNVSLFVNYDLPTRESYLKKIGSRKKRCPKYLVVNIITNKELNKLMSYAKYFNTHIVSLPISEI